MKAGHAVPDAATLLQAAGDYLEGELLPTLAGYHRFQTRVTLNVLRIVARELALAPEQHASQHARLAALLEHDAPTETLEQELSQGLLEGRIALDDPALVAHLRATLRERLAIHHPGWADDAAAPPSAAPQGDPAP